MTREEAKRILEFDLDHTHNDESKEALRMAIKALEQDVPDINVGDMISRQVVKEQMHKYGFLAPDMTVSEFIEDLPYVTPQPKTENTIKMRDATPEERESIDKYIKSISKATGVNFWDLYKEPCEDWYDVHSNEMTLDQARQAVKDLRKKLAEHLEREPCEDAISRQAVIDGINRYFHDDYYQRTSIQDCRDCLIEDVINELPPVQPEQKTGHWVEENINKGSRKIFCSECGCPPPFEYVSDGDVYSANGYGVINKTKFCPNCGAKMQKVTE